MNATAVVDAGSLGNEMTSTVVGLGCDPRVKPLNSHIQTVNGTYS